MKPSLALFVLFAAVQLAQGRNSRFLELEQERNFHSDVPVKPDSGGHHHVGHTPIKGAQHFIIIISGHMGVTVLNLFQVSPSLPPR